MTVLKKQDQFPRSVGSDDGVFSPLRDPLPGRSDDIDFAGRLAMYSNAASPDQPPLLLIHSVNAAASAFEVKPLFENYRGQRPVYAIDLPGFGQSDRSNRAYTVRLMTDAVITALTKIRERHDAAADAVALSLSCEFLARAALEKPELIRTLGLISPTGFEGKARDDEEGTRGQKWLHRTLNFPVWRRGLFRLLTTKVVIRKFLQKTWGSKTIDEPLLDYDYETTHQPGAEHAPYYFVSGYLFSRDILNVYQALTHAVWMVHGTKGDFVDYHHASRVKTKANWRLQVFETGAFPHFEALAPLVASYDNFLIDRQPIITDVGRGSILKEDPKMTALDPFPTPVKTT